MVGSNHAPLPLQPLLWDAEFCRSLGFGANSRQTGQHGSMQNNQLNHLYDLPVSEVSTEFCSYGYPTVDQAYHLSRLERVCILQGLSNM